VLQLIEANKYRGSLSIDLGKRNDFLLLRGASTGALFFHQLLETRSIHGQTALARHQFGEVERETVGVVEFERKLAWKLWQLNTELFEDAPEVLLNINSVIRQ